MGKFFGKRSKKAESTKDYDNPISFGVGWVMVSMDEVTAIQALVYAADCKVNNHESMISLENALENLYAVREREEELYGPADEAEIEIVHEREIQLKFL
jgi:hypothetical protein